MTPYGFFKVGSKEGLTFKKRYNYLAEGYRVRAEQ